VTGRERILARRRDQQFDIPVSKRSRPACERFDDMISQYVSDQHGNEHADTRFSVFFCEQKDNRDHNPYRARVA